MAALLRRLRSVSNSPAHGAGKGDAEPADMFLIQVIAFGEVFAVPVCKTTPVTVVLRHVMEATVPEEQAAGLGDVEATLYYKDKPLQLDATMTIVPRNAILHLHSSVSATSSILHNCRHGAVSMLPGSRRRCVNTTVTMHPCLRSKRVAGVREVSNSPASHRRSSGFAGLSSDGSPHTERHESPTAARLGSISECASSAYHETERMSMPTPPDAAPVMMWPPAMLPMMSTTPVRTTAGAEVADVAPCYYFVPCADAATRAPIRLLRTQGRTESAPSLTASRRRDSAVEFANSYPYPPAGISPLDTAAIAVADPSSFSPLPSPPNVPAVTADRFTGSNDKHLAVYLRLPRDQAAACMSAAALNGDRNIVVKAAEEDGAPAEALLNATTSTVGTTTSRATRAYVYRSLRVLRDFPVGTLRELYAVPTEHRLHAAHAEVEDERKTFREMRVAPNTVFYFKRRAEAGGDAGVEQRGSEHPLTRERIGATAAVPQPPQMQVDRCTEMHHTPSPIDSARPSAGRSFPSAPAPVLSGTTPSSRAHSRTPSIPNSGVHPSTLSICERIDAFNGAAAHHPSHDTRQAVRVVDDDAEADSALAPPGRHVLEGDKQTMPSAVSTEEARRAADSTALRTEVETAGHRQPSPKPCDSAKGNSSVTADSPRGIRAAAVDAEVLRVDADGCLGGDAGEVSVAAAAAAGSEASGRELKKMYRLQRRSPAVAPANPTTCADVLRGEEEATAESACTTASTQLPKTRRLSKLVAKLEGLRRHRVKSTPASTALTPPHLASEVLLSVSAADLVQPAVEVGEPHQSFTAPVNVGSTCRLHAAEEVVDTQPKRKRPKGPVKKSVAAEKGEQPSKGTPALSRTTSTGSFTTKTKRSNSAPFFKPLRRRSSLPSRDDGAAQPPSFSKDASTATPLAAASSLTPPSSEEVLKALKRKSVRLSSKKRLEETVGAAATATTTIVPSSGKVAARAAGEAATAESVERSKAGVEYTPVPAKAAREAGSPSRGSGASYSQRNCRAGANVPSQPVAFLGSDLRQGAGITPPAATAHVAAASSATVEPAVLSSTRVPPRRDSHIPISILIAPARPQSGGQQRKNRAPGSHSSEPANLTAALRRSSAENCTAEYSVESPSSAHRLRITLRDLQDTTRFHYGIPVEPDCPIGSLREWLAAMQRPSSGVGKAAPDLSDAKRYGIFVGDELLPAADSETFAEATGSRNDIIFSIRPLLGAAAALRTHRW
ncbi:hypothetical protein LSCM1_06480 [Leishmania martiniquensis]|uniref:Uncharacterized protein n=1 Tax=Leishmania martiniquensis TaxID=1580590 RepID=A0A836HLA5_9TRYP|nr:hypothetical protein LSCM1_06480 [Leishmania martiniquensis]